MFNIFNMPDECAGIFDLCHIKARLQIKRMLQQIPLGCADDMLLLSGIDGRRT